MPEYFDTLNETKETEETTLGNAQSHPNAKKDKTLKISLVSGELLTVNALKLYDAHVLQKINALREKARIKMGGQSSGLGFIGSLGWVVTASLVQGAFESISNKSLAAEGMGYLREAENIYNNLRQSGNFYPVSIIDNIEYPDPSAWIVKNSEIREYMEGGWLPKKVKGSIVCAYVHSGDPFITVKNTDGVESCISLDKIEQYKVLC